MPTFGIQINSQTNLLSMAEATKTHWKKNNDSKYISGEDLFDSVHGLRPEMDVEISAFEDVESFDQNEQKKITKTGLFLSELNGTRLHKPMILNNTNAKFLADLTKSPIMEDWIGAKVTLYAKPDRRFNYVARFKKYVVKNTTDPKPALDKIKKAKDLDALINVWTGLAANEQNLPEVLAAKNARKEVLSK